MPNSARTGECVNHSRRRKLATRRICPMTTAQTRSRAGMWGGAGHRPVAASRTSGPDSDRRSFGLGEREAPSTGLLFAPQHEQLGIGGEDLAQSVLKGAAGCDAPADVVHPVFGNALDPFFASGHEGQRPGGVLLAVGAMAGGFTATGKADGQRAGEQILGECELAEQGKLALAEAGGLGRSE